MATWTGWLAFALVPLAAAIPVGFRLLRHKRAAPGSPPIRWHIVVGLSLSAVAFAHTLAAVLELGSPSAIAAGELGLGFGAAAFLLLLAHTGLGFQLRNPKLRRRGDKRRQHVMSATLVTVAIALHVAMLLTA